MLKYVVYYKCCLLTKVVLTFVDYFCAEERLEVIRVVIACTFKEPECDNVMILRYDDNIAQTIFIRNIPLMNFLRTFIVNGLYKIMINQILQSLEGFRSIISI